jgi:SAF domain
MPAPAELHPERRTSMKLKPATIGFAAAVLGGALFFVYTRRFEIETAGGDRVDILVAAERIERGTVISEGILTMRSIPQAYVDDRVVRLSEREKIMGLKAAESLTVSQSVLWSDVVTNRDDKRDLSSLVQAGYRAVTAPFTANPTFSMIHAGDFVDVLSVVRLNRSASASIGSRDRNRYIEWARARQGKGRAAKRADFDAESQSPRGAAHIACSAAWRALGRASQSKRSTCRREPHGPRFESS